MVAGWLRNNAVQPLIERIGQIFHRLPVLAWAETACVCTTTDWLDACSTCGAAKVDAPGSSSATKVQPRHRTKR